ncbi:MAG: 8-amino-7-oxononanoate synthase [Alphaproteobacteria bacterium]|jgi:8-amino-7-oxononanoate synthase|nr:8-amino-7-oxononanoate synthase [Alphaproteobacteria bacterium]
MRKFKEKLEQLDTQNRLRTLNLPRGIDFTSNDYLGLRAHPKLREAAIAALESGLDIGAGGSRLLRGHTESHAELENFAARYFGAGGALFFATGFQANAAIFGALPERGDTIIFDALIHASARDGIQASNAAHVRVAHNDLDAFEDALENAKGQRWIAVESVYSMDGDVAPLAELHKLAEKYDAYLIVDEAHGTGVFGANGKGVSEGLPHDRLITLHTCGKALGVAGGLVCASKDVIDYLINKARPFIYSTAPMPLQAVLVKRALELVQEEPERRQKLHKLMHYATSVDFLDGLFGNHFSPILPVVVGDDAAALRFAAGLQKKGFDVRAIRPPTVPENTARLRVSLSINLTEQNLRDLSEAILPLLRQEAA